MIEGYKYCVSVARRAPDTYCVELNGSAVDVITRKMVDGGYLMQVMMPVVNRFIDLLIDQLIKFDQWIDGCWAPDAGRRLRHAGSPLLWRSKLFASTLLWFNQQFSTLINREEEVEKYEKTTNLEGLTRHRPDCRSMPWPALTAVLCRMLRTPTQVDGESHVVHVEEEALGTRLLVNSLTVLLATQADPSRLVSASPGKLVRHLVPSGTRLAPDQAYAEVEVMKMVMPLLAPAAGVVTFVKPEGCVLAAGERGSRMRRGAGGCGQRAGAGEGEGVIVVQRCGQAGGAFPPPANGGQCCGCRLCAPSRFDDTKRCCAVLRCDASSGVKSVSTAHSAHHRSQHRALCRAKRTASGGPESVHSAPAAAI